MKTWIALLRGINVGGNNIVPMKELVALMEVNGFSDVKTYIQSGNVVFKNETRAGDQIADLIDGKFGFKPSVFVLSEDELKAAAANSPFQTEVGKALHFFFCDQIPQSVDYEFLDGLKAPSEEYQLIDKVFYLYAPDGIGRSKLAEKMGRTFKDVTITARNLNTINKLIGMIG
ncbi:DUF1697 domain-containing protein [Roseivirga sp. E12]|uniref:DUF1697 domain-containing protein n=1 Tax=Roseivirga sp. E12 TaxID=2819237 RepID=UPI001ABBF5CE|nr:DUF1697 domain-containing protein [Roseivirga sp. E12]MBO3696808.1 DUF1697 domain-containing protein [Roseivirga sp. E12]